ncbi:MAG: hypothetical protein KatS3mg111_2448 [Pirellulaceae bacterium]|nr:MAG: hypothetical protein KatS3mg111_2448 [Pirellulaceae bacterium]
MDSDGHRVRFPNQPGERFLIRAPLPNPGAAQASPNRHYIVRFASAH